MRRLVRREPTLQACPAKQQTGLSLAHRFHGSERRAPALGPEPPLLLENLGRLSSSSVAEDDHYGAGEQSVPAHR